MKKASINKVQVSEPCIRECDNRVLSRCGIWWCKKPAYMCYISFTLPSFFHTFASWLNAAVQCTPPPCSTNVYYVKVEWLQCRRQGDKNDCWEEALVRRAMTAEYTRGAWDETTHILGQHFATYFTDVAQMNGYKESHVDWTCSQWYVQIINNSLHVPGCPYTLHVGFAQFSLPLITFVIALLITYLLYSASNKTQTQGLVINNRLRSYCPNYLRCNTYFAYVFTNWTCNDSTAWTYYIFSNEPQRNTPRVISAMKYQLICGQ